MLIGISSGATPAANRQISCPLPAGATVGVSNIRPTGTKSANLSIEGFLRPNKMLSQQATRLVVEGRARHCRHLAVTRSPPRAPTRRGREGRGRTGANARRSRRAAGDPRGYGPADSSGLRGLQAAGAAIDADVPVDLSDPRAGDEITASRRARSSEPTNMWPSRSSRASLSSACVRISAARTERRSAVAAALAATPVSVDEGPAPDRSVGRPLRTLALRVRACPKTSRLAPGRHVFRAPRCSKAGADATESLDRTVTRHDEACAPR